MDFFNFLRDGEKLLDSKILVAAGNVFEQRALESKQKAFENLKKYYKHLLTLPDTKLEIYKKVLELLEEFAGIYPLNEINEYSIKLFNEPEEIRGEAVSGIREMIIGFIGEKIKEDLAKGKKIDDQEIAKKIKNLTRTNENFYLNAPQIKRSNADFLQHYVEEIDKSGRPLIDDAKTLRDAINATGPTGTLSIEEKINRQIEFLNYIWPKFTRNEETKIDFRQLIRNRDETIVSKLINNIHPHDVIAYINENTEYNLEPSSDKQDTPQTILDRLKNEGFTLSDDSSKENTQRENTPDFVESLRALKYAEAKFNEVLEANKLDNFQNLRGKYKKDLLSLIKRLQEFYQDNFNVGKFQLSDFFNFLEKNFDVETNSIANNKTYQELQENVITDGVYTTKTLDSNDERLVIEIIRDIFQLRCVPSSALIPGPDNEEYSYFKIDFVLYCNVLKNNEIKKETFLLGEYYGFNESKTIDYRKDAHEAQAKEFEDKTKLFYELSNKENKTEEEKNEIIQLGNEIKKLNTDLGTRGNYIQRQKYKVKSQIKTQYENFIARQINADTIQINEPPSGIKERRSDYFKRELKTALNAKGVIFKTSDNESSEALKKLEENGIQKPEEISVREAFVREAKVYVETYAIKRKIDLVKKNTPQFWKNMNEAIRAIADQYLNNESAKTIFKMDIANKKSLVYASEITENNDNPVTSRMIMFKNIVLNTIEKVFGNTPFLEEAKKLIMDVKIPSPNQFAFTPDKLNILNLNEMQTSTNTTNTAIFNNITNAAAVKNEKLDELSKCSESIEEDEKFYARVKYIVEKETINGNKGLKNYDPCFGDFIDTVAKTFNLKRFAKINVKYTEERIIPMNEIKKIQLLQNLVKLSQMAEEIENDNPEAAGLIDKSVEEIGNAAQNATDIRPEEVLEDKSKPLPFTEPDNFPRIDNPEFDIEKFRKDIIETLAKEIINDPNTSKSELLNIDYLKEKIDQKIDEKQAEAGGNTKESIS